eukprot:403349345
MKASDKNIGWIGTGTMGIPMAGHLLKNGFSVNINTRTPSKAQTLIDQGAVYIEDQSELASKCDILFLMLGHPDEVKDLLFNQERGLLQFMQDGSIIVDHSTNKPTYSQEIYQKCKERGIRAIDAPVSGAETGAINGRLVCMVGGDIEILDEIQQYLKCYTQAIQHMGIAGCGQHTKMCNQMMIANNYIGICESLLYGYKAKIDLNQMIDLLTKGAANTFLFQHQAKNTIQREFSVGFSLELFIKDASVALEEANRLGVGLPGLAQALQFYTAAFNLGYGQKGPNALLCALETINGTKIVGYENIDKTL